jgi:hypothetical protein
MRHFVAVTRRLLFGLLALSNVHCNAAHPSRLTITVKLHLTTAGNPAHFPIR